MKIKNRVLSKGTLKISQLEEFQGSLKKLGDKEKDKLKRNLLKNGIITPFFVWTNDGVNYVLDGHARLQCLSELAEEGKIEAQQEVDCVFLKMKDEKEAKQCLLYITSQYNRITERGLEFYMEDFNLTFDELEDINFDAFNVDKSLGINKDGDSGSKYDDIENLEPSLTLRVFLDTEDEQEKLFTELAERGYNVKL